MKLKLYQIDAFTGKLFGGNPAAVIPLKKWIPDELMQQLAMENNLAETVFFVPSKKGAADYDIRWFTPVLEINLCGHATLASAFVIFTILKEKKKSVTFSSKSGLLTVKNKKNGHGIGLENLKSQLNHLYAENFKLQIREDDQEKFGVSLIISKVRR